MYVLRIFVFVNRFILIATNVSVSNFVISSIVEKRVQRYVNISFHRKNTIYTVDI